jgi:hypothetical protein
MFTETSQEEVDNILEKETLQNKSETWNKLNKTQKLQKLNTYAEKYGAEQKYGIKEIKNLKQFFLDSLERGKLQKTKEVIYDKNTQTIQEVPGLFLHPTNHNFTLRIMDNKRVSTLKSLAPKRISEKNKIVLKDTEAVTETSL